MRIEHGARDADLLKDIHDERPAFPRDTLTCQFDSCSTPVNASHACRPSDRASEDLVTDTVAKASVNARSAARVERSRDTFRFPPPFRRSYPR